MKKTEAAQVFQISRNTINLWLQRKAETGDVKAKSTFDGMAEDVKAKIFDHLFTTKGVGKGTGLGLAIARQIVVEKHIKLWWKNTMAVWKCNLSWIKVLSFASAYRLTLSS